MLRRGHLTFSVIARCAPAAAATIPFSQRIAKYAVDDQDMRWLSRAVDCTHHQRRRHHSSRGRRGDDPSTNASSAAADTIEKLQAEIADLQTQKQTLEKAKEDVARSRSKMLQRCKELLFERAAAERRLVEQQRQHAAEVQEAHRAHMQEVERVEEQLYSAQERIEKSDLQQQTSREKDAVIAGLRQQLNDMTRRELAALYPPCKAVPEAPETRSNVDAPPKSTSHASAASAACKFQPPVLRPLPVSSHSAEVFWGSLAVIGVFAFLGAVESVINWRRARRAAADEIVTIEAPCEISPAEAAPPMSSRIAAVVSWLLAAMLRLALYCSAAVTVVNHVLIPAAARYLVPIAGIEF